MILKRILAQIVDIIVYIIITGAMIILIASSVKNINVFIVLLSVIIIQLLYFAIQYPFLKVNQTIGKGFFRLYIVSTNNRVKITPMYIVQREILFKVMPCFLLSLNVLIGRESIHDKCCFTKVISK